MKESAQPNYFVKVQSLAGAVSLEMHALQPRGLLVTVNGIVDIALVESLRAEPWPPLVPRSHDHWSSAEEAAEYLFEVSAVTIAPGSAAMVKHAVGEVGQECTAFFLPRDEFDVFREDVYALFQTPVTPPSLGVHRLEQLVGRPFGDFLTHRLNQAQLGEHKRRILCLDPIE